MHKYEGPRLCIECQVVLLAFESGEKCYKCARLSPQHQYSTSEDIPDRYARRRARVGDEWPAHCLLNFKLDLRGE